MTSTITAPATGATALAAGTWTGDASHSDISFTVRHMGVGRVRGTFALTSAVLEVDETTGVHAIIDAASVHTGNDQRDAHLRSADFLDTAAYPTIEFTSTAVRDFDGRTFTLVGALTLHGTTRVVELQAEFGGVVDDPAGVRRTGFSATTTISRSAYGVDVHLPFGAGDLVIADHIEIAIDIEFTAAATTL